MKIVIIGSGNVAAVLGRRFKAAGHSILQVIGRNAAAASELAYEWNTVSSNYLSAVNLHGDVYLIAVSDEAIPDIVKDMKLPGKVVAHTAASVPMKVLKSVTSHYGVFYPLQSLRKDAKSIPEIPIFIEGVDTVTREKLESLARSISKEQVVEADGNALLKLHVAGVVVSNFTNHLYALAEQYCKKEGIDFQELLPLIMETAGRLKTISPRQAQTGPAIRHDAETIQKHLALLKGYPQLHTIYEAMSNSIGMDVH